MSNGQYSWTTIDRDNAHPRRIVQQQGSVEPYLHVTLCNPDGTPCDTTGWQWVGLVLPGFERTILMLALVDGPTGHHLRAWAHGDTDAAGRWGCEIQGVNASGGFVNFGNGTFVVEATIS